MHVATRARRTLRAALAYAAVAAVLCPGILVAQSRPALRALELPEGETMRCRVLPVAPDLAPAARRLVFSFGDVRREDRSIAVTFDSLGRPLEMVDTAAELVGGDTTVMHGVLVGFATDSGGAGVRTRLGPVEEAALAAADSAGRATLSARLTTALTVDEIGRARALAAWLYQHRCGRPP